MEDLIQLKLEYISEFQQKYPNSHVGGSIGLFLHKIDLKRDLEESDIDITTDRFDKNNLSKLHNVRKPSSGSTDEKGKNDFDFAFTYYYPDKKTSIKIDICVNPAPSFDVVEFGYHYYNVSKLEDILFWKEKYAKKGIQKHIKDLRIIYHEMEEFKKREVYYPF